MNDQYIDFLGFIQLDRSRLVRAAIVEGDSRSGLRLVFETGDGAPRRVLRLVDLPIVEGGAVRAILAAAIGPAWGGGAVSAACGETRHIIESAFVENISTTADLERAAIALNLSHDVVALTIHSMIADHTILRRPSGRLAWGRNSRIYRRRMEEASNVKIW